METYPKVEPNLSRAKHSKVHTTSKHHRGGNVESSQVGSPNDDEYDEQSPDIENQKQNFKKNDNTTNFWMYAFAFAAVVIIVILIIFYFWKSRSESDSTPNNGDKRHSNRADDGRNTGDDKNNENGDDASKNEEHNGGSKSKKPKNNTDTKKVKFSEENEFLNIINNKNKVDLDAPITDDGDGDDGDDNGDGDEGGHDAADDDGDSETASGILSDGEEEIDDGPVIRLPKYLRSAASRKKENKFASKLVDETISLKDLRSIIGNFTCKEFTKFLATKEVKKFLN